MKAELIEGMLFVEADNQEEAFSLIAWIESDMEVTVVVAECDVPLNVETTGVH